MEKGLKEALQRIEKNYESKIKKLYLNNLDLQFIPIEIAQLIHLKVLDLRFNQISKIEGLENLQNLTVIYLESNQISKIEGLKNLQNLTVLDLSSNQIKKIESLEQLQNLTRIYLNSNQIKKIEGLQQLQNLAGLYLSSNQIKKIEGLGQLQNLTVLDLSSNQIKKIEGLEQLQSLAGLYLSSNQIKKIEGLEQQRQLNSVDIANNSISNLQSIISIFKKNPALKIANKEDFHLLSDKGFNINKYPLAHPPIEIAEKGIAAIKDYFDSFEPEDAAIEEVYLNEAKLLLVGEERAGKSTVAELLSQPDYTFELGKKSTEGIDILQWQIKKEASSLADDFTFHIWDFGGQDIYHATHQYFLTKRSLYIFITEVRKDLRFDEFYYWLHIINTLAPDCPVLVVQNKADQPHQQQSIKLYTKIFPQIINSEIIEISCDNNCQDWENKFADNLQQFKLSIYHLLKDKKLPGYGDPLPPKWLSVRKRIGELKDADNNNITYTKYEALCLEEGLSITQAKTLASYLNDIGVFTWFEDMDLKKPFT